MGTTTTVIRVYIESTKLCDGVLRGDFYVSYQQYSARLSYCFYHVVRTSLLILLTAVLSVRLSPIFCRVL